MPDSLEFHKSREDSTTSMEKRAPEMAPTTEPLTGPLSVAKPVRAPAMAPAIDPTALNHANFD